MGERGLRCRRRDHPADLRAVQVCGPGIASFRQAAAKTSVSRMLAVGSTRFLVNDGEAPAAGANTSVLLSARSRTHVCGAAVPVGRGKTAPQAVDQLVSAGNGSGQGRGRAGE